MRSSGIAPRNPRRSDSVGELVTEDTNLWKIASSIAMQVQQPIYFFMVSYQLITNMLKINHRLSFITVNINHRFSYVLINVTLKRFAKPPFSVD